MLIPLPVVSIPSLIINSIILFFVKLVGPFIIFESFKYSDNTSLDTLSRKIASCSFGILLCFIKEIAKYEEDIIIYALVQYKMDNYFIEYPKLQLYTYSIGKSCSLNLKFDYDGKDYLFVEYINKNSRFNNAFKRILELKDKRNDLYLLLSMVIDQLKIDSSKNEFKNKKGEFKYTIFPDQDNDLKFKKEVNPTIYVFTDDIYYNHTSVGLKIYAILEKKLPGIHFTF